MDIPQDPFILLSFINMKLRDQYASFDDLCEDMNLDKDLLKDKLKSAGFEYNPDINQFR